MIIGTHIAISSTNENADKAFLKDVLKLPFVDAGGGYLIFAGSAAEFAVHESGGAPELYLMCRSMDRFLSEMNKKTVSCAPLRHASYGILTEIVLPGGAKLGVYEPRHKRPTAGKRGGRRAAAKTKKPGKKAAKKSVRRAKKKR